MDSLWLDILKYTEAGMATRSYVILYNVHHVKAAICTSLFKRTPVQRF